MQNIEHQFIKIYFLIQIFPSTRTLALRPEDAPQRYFKGKDDKDTLWPNFTNLYIKQAGTKETKQKLLMAILKCTCSRIYCSYSDKTVFKHIKFGSEEDLGQISYLITNFKTVLTPIDHL